MGEIDHVPSDIQITEFSKFRRRSKLQANLTREKLYLQMS